MEYERYLPDDVTIVSLVDETNIAELLDEEGLVKIGAKVVEGYTQDELSRGPWITRYNEGLKLAMQVKEMKSWPWPKASNIKFPQLTLAAITFHARAYPSLVPSRELVNVKVFGPDPNGLKVKRADRVKLHMNYQFLDQMEEWEEDMDRLLLTLPLTGTEFKKAFYSPTEERNVSKLVLAKDLAVDYYAKSLDKAERKTEILSMSLNEIREMINAGLFLDVDLSGGIVQNDQTKATTDKIQGKTPPADTSEAPRTILEQHGFCDLDGDGYKEPYIITVDKDTKQVLRIVARFQKENIVTKQGLIVKIKPEEYYIKYSFIPSPDGGFYDIGFGHLLGPLNESINSIINQLVDAGTLSNLQSGFISKQFKQKGGNLQFEPGEWKLVNAAMQDLKQGIFPLPVREPSNVLFSLLQFLLEIGQRISSTTDIMVGENPGQNQKATTTQAVVENGMRVFTAIYKRLRRALTKEILRVYQLNKLYFDIREYATIVDVGVDSSELEQDYEDEDLDIRPSADPNAVSQVDKMIKAQALLQMIQLGAPVRPILMRYYEALEIENPEEVLPPEQPPPNPELMIKMAEQQLDEAEFEVDASIRTREQKRKELETLHKIRQGDTKLDLEAGKAQADAMVSTMDSVNKRLSDREKADAAKQKQVNS